MPNHDLKAEEYRARARAASVAADSAVLARVRERHEQAARTWADLAEAEDARVVTRRAASRPAPVDAEQPAPLDAEPVT
jgi:hypothetical protein